MTRTKTSVLGSPPTTRTLLLTHTMTTTTVETVTETLLRPTSVVSTVTSTILQPIVTRVPSTYNNIADNDSIFVVMSDQKPPVPGGEEVLIYEINTIRHNKQKLLIGVFYLRNLFFFIFLKLIFSYQIITKNY